MPERLAPSNPFGRVMKLRIRNWGKFQHYKFRKPAWIKLYREILDDPEWHALSGESAKGLIMLWLLASEEDGYIPDSSTLAFRLRISENRAIALLSDCSKWIETDASMLLAECYHDASTEIETELEKEKILSRQSTPASAGIETYMETPYFKVADWKLEELEKQYMPLNVKGELEKMKNWLDANPKRRKKKYDRFIVNWLNKAHAQVVSAQVNARLAARAGSQGAGRAVYSADDRAYYERLGIKI